MVPDRAGIGQCPELPAYDRVSHAPAALGCFAKPAGTEAAPSGGRIMGDLAVTEHARLGDRREQRLRETNRAPRRSRAGGRLTS